MKGRFFARVLAALRALIAECRREESLAVLLVTLILVTRQALASEPGVRLLGGFWSALARALPVLTYQALRFQVISVVLQLLVPLLAIWLLHRKRLRDYGLGLGDVRFWLPIVGLVVVVQLVAIAGWLHRAPAYTATYPTLEAARAGGGVFWIWEGSRVLYMLSWEFLFRGYLLLALEKRLGLLAAVVQTVPFVLMHLVGGKPFSEVYFTVGSGLLSGVLVLECRSVWPVVFLHAGGAVLLDVFIVYAGR